MATSVLTDVSRDLWVESFGLAAADLGRPEPHRWTVVKQVLRGGRRDGVDRIVVDNGALSFAVVPTRGMGIWKVSYRDDDVGWSSPVRDGPVHPALVDLQGGGGIGWLDGFDETIVRCGLAHNGPPVRDGEAILPLHGRIANIPAHYVAVHVADDPPHEIVVEGVVDESRLFGPQLRLSCRIETTPGSNRMTVRDTVTNLGGAPAGMQLLYHGNFGPPHLEAGSRFVAAARTVVPRDARAAEGIGHYDIFGPPEVGFAEQVYYVDLLGDGPEGRTAVMLRNQAGDRAVALRFPTERLPCFTLWKNTGGLTDGYVAGLEPAVNYPNSRPFEARHGRVLTLDPGASYSTEFSLDVLVQSEEIASLEAEINALRGQTQTTLRPSPSEPFAPQS